MRGQFECDVTWFCFCFDFVSSNARCGCCSLVYLCFQVVQIKKVDCKLSTFLYLNVGEGGGVKLQIFAKKQIHLIIIKE